MRLGCGFCANQDHEADGRDADDIGNLITAVRYMGQIDGEREKCVHNPPSRITPDNRNLCEVGCYNRHTSGRGNTSIATSVAVFGMKTLMKYLKGLTHEPDYVLFHKKLTGVH